MWYWRFRIITFRGSSAGMLHRDGKLVRATMHAQREIVVTAEYCNGTTIKPQLVGLTEELTACKRVCEACMAAGLHRSPLHREKDDLKLNFVLWTLEFSCWFSFVLWLWLWFWKSGATWTGWQACLCLHVWPPLCHRARQIMLIPPVFFAASRFVSCLIRWSVKFGIIHWTWNSRAVLSATWWSFVLSLLVCLHFSWAHDFLLFFE